MSSSRFILALTLLAAGGCHRGTFAVVHIDRGASTPSTVRTIELDLTLTGAGAAKTTLSEPGGGNITLPTDVTLAIQHGAGAITVVAIARDAGGHEVDRGSGSGTVVAGKTATVEVRLGGGAVLPDGGANDLADGMQPGADLAGTDLGATFTLTVSYSGAGSGTITTMPGGISCPGTCSYDFPAGTVVTLQPAGDRGSAFVGWSGDCTGQGPCSVTMSQARSVAAVFEKVNVVFTSSTTYTGNLGGVAAADHECMLRAQAAGLPNANTAGAYVAYLSQLNPTQVTALAHLGTANGWVRPDGKPFAASRAAIQSGQIYYPPNLDENGNVLPDARTASGQYTDNSVGYNCSDWSTSSNMSFFVQGTTIGGATCWSYLFTQTCDQPFHLVCFGTSYNTIYAPPPRATGRIAFVSHGSFDPKSGRPAADTLCATEAAAAHLPGTYLAFMSTHTATGANPSDAPAAASRFSSAGAPWVRSDGLPLTASAADFLSLAKLITPPEVEADGTTHVDANVNIWTGSIAPGNVAGDATEDCAEWTSDTNGTGERGQGCLLTTSFVDQQNFVYTPWSTTKDACSNPGGRVYCLQQ